MALYPSPLRRPPCPPSPSLVDPDPQNRARGVGRGAPPPAGPLPAQEERSCAALAGSVGGVTLIDISNPGPGASGGRIKVRIAEDGSADARAIFHDRWIDTFNLPDAPPVLVAVPGSARVVCEDLNNDGVAGLTVLEVEVAGQATGKRVHLPLVLRTTPDQDIDGGRRIYTMTITCQSGLSGTDGTCTSLTTDVDVLVKFLPKGKHDAQRRAKGGKAGDGEHGKRHR